MTKPWEQQVKAQIRKRYAAQAASENDGIAKAGDHGYPPALLYQLPRELVAGYSGCGYLFEDLNFHGDEIVIDLGCGAGLDSWIAASHIPSGQVYSVDMTFEMIAEINGANIHAICGDIEAVPFADAIADVVIANASFNLTTSKATAFAEAFRILKPGGRLASRDLIREGELPSEVLTDPLSYNTSLGGALKEEDLRTQIEQAGFENVSISDHRPFSYVQSVKIEAFKSE